MVISWFDDAWRSKTEQIVVCLLDAFHGMKRERENEEEEEEEKVKTCSLKVTVK
jgi:hypothetical protein